EGKSEGRMLLPAGAGKVNRRPNGALFPGKRHGSTRFKVFNDRRRHSDAAPVIARNKMSRPAPVVSVAALLIAAVVALVPVQDAGALTVTEEEFLCPIDYSVSERIIVKSFTVFDRRLDFRPVGALISPPPIPVCDSNGFVLYQDEFTEAELTALRDLVTSEEFRHVREENGDWYVAGWLAERMGKPKSRTHYMYLYAAWAEEGGGDRLRMER